MDFALEFFPSAPTLRDVCARLFLKKTMDPPRWRLANSTWTTVTSSRLLYCAHVIIDNGPLLRRGSRVECWRMCTRRRVRMYIPERVKTGCEDVSPVLRATYDPDVTRSDFDTRQLKPPFPRRSRGVPLLSLSVSTRRLFRSQWFT